MTTPIRPSDLTFLNMDRPTNLMIVNGLMWFDEEPDWDAVRATVRERLIERFPVLSRRPALIDGSWMWQDDPDFDFDRHVQEVTIGGSADLAAAQLYISNRVSVPMDKDHPLWEIDILRGLSGEGDEPKALMLARFHHAMADGIRIVQLVLSMCDLAEDAAPPVVGRKSSSKGPGTQALKASKDVVGGMMDFAGGLGSAALGAPGKLLGKGRDVFEEGFDFDLDVSITGLTDAVTSVASADNKLANSVRSASRLALSGRSPELTGDGKPGIAKRVAWVTGLPVAEVKAVGAAHGATINDVLLAVVSRGLSRYVEERDRDLADEVNFLVPISLKPIDMNLPTELGNYFAMVMFPMPLGVSGDNELMSEISTRMTRIKNSTEAMMVFGLQRAVAETPSSVSVGITEFVANKTIGLLTNVPGPRAPMYLAGTEVSGILGWVPTAADQSLGICIFSYNGTVSMGIASDAGIMPDPERLAELITDEFAALAAATLAESN